MAHIKDGHKCEFCTTIVKSVEARSNHMLQHNFECHNCHLIFPLKANVEATQICQKIHLCHLWKSSCHIARLPLNCYTTGHK